MQLLDTMVLSALRRPNMAPKPLVEFADRMPRDETFVSVISIMEIETGAMLLSRRDPRQGQMLTDWLLGTLLPHYGDRLLPVTLQIARECAKLHVPDPKPYRDALIAATALVHGLTLVTRNTKDFATTGVDLLNPWQL